MFKSLKKKVSYNFSNYKKLMVKKKFLVIWVGTGTRTGTGNYSKWWILFFSLSYFASNLYYYYLYGSGSVFWIRIRVHKVVEYGSNLDPDPQFCFTNYNIFGSDFLRRPDDPQSNSELKLGLRQSFNVATSDNATQQRIKASVTR